MRSKLDSSRFVVGYHGCDVALAQKVLLGDEQLTPSSNTYDCRKEFDRLHV